MMAAELPLQRSVRPYVISQLLILGIRVITLPKWRRYRIGPSSLMSDLLRLNSEGSRIAYQTSSDNDLHTSHKPL